MMGKKCLAAALLLLAGPVLAVPVMHDGGKEMRSLRNTHDRTDHPHSAVSALATPSSEVRARPAPW